MITVKKYRDLFVYDEKGKVAVTVAKVTKTQEGELLCTDSRQHIVRILPFFYKSRYLGDLSIGTTANVAKIYKGTTIKVMQNGKVIIKTKKEIQTFSLWWISD